MNRRQLVRAALALLGGLALGAAPALAQQSSNRTMVGGAPSVTVMNGGTGYFSDTVIRPFVTGFTPVVGSGGFGTAPPAGGPGVLQERLARLRAGEVPARPPMVAERSSEPAGAAVLPSGGSTAERGDMSVAEIKAAKAAEHSLNAAANHAEIEALSEKARVAEVDGKTGLARLYLQMAERRARGDRQEAIRRLINSLGVSRAE
jgi:hypothetical protein